MAFFLYGWATPVWADLENPATPEQTTKDSSPSTKCSQCHRQNGSPTTDLKQPQCRQCHDPDANLSYNNSRESQSETLRVKSSRTDEALVQQKMVSIPAGEFTMGNNGRGTVDGPGDPDETPSHKVYLDAFEMDLYETTNAMYQKFVEATGHRPPKHWKGNHYPEGKANHPVVYVDWFDADAFCQWADKRLPTEEEWERAARGMDERIFPWGNTFSNKMANTPQYWLAKGANEDTLGLKGGTLPVGSFEHGKSPYGLYDMAGNVYEWTSSWYLPYPGNKVWNMHYGQKNKVLRGGSWYDCLSYGCGLSAPTYNRSRFSPEIKNMGFGFRCAKSSQL
jgi:formylglycine-generating enzyme required for sulfatase activity